MAEEHVPKRRGRPPKARPLIPPAEPLEAEDAADNPSAAIRELLGKRPPAPRVSQDELVQLQDAFRAVASGDDDWSKQRRSQIQAILRGLRHEDIHPDEPIVEIDVPWSLFNDAHGRPIPYTISGIAYQGPVKVWRCIAQQLAWMISTSEAVDRQRMRERKVEHNLDNPLVTRTRIIEQP